MLKTRLLDNRTLPLIVEPSDSTIRDAHSSDLLSEFSANKPFLEGKLLEHGALLFRGFSVESASQFEQCAKCLLSESLSGYIDGTSPRTRVQDGVYTSTEYPPEYFISLHNELSYSHAWPRRIAFCCIVAPQEGGETPIVDSRKLLNAIPIHVVNQFRAKGVMYIRNLHGGYGFGPAWTSVFETHEKSVVERYCQNGGGTYIWKADGGLQLNNVRPAIASHPQTQEEVWFNQADQFHPTELPEHDRQSLLSLIGERDLPKNARFGDGTPLEESMLAAIRTATRESMVCFQWQKGDVLLLDNMLVAHGRMPFSGPRSILVAMA